MLGRVARGRSNRYAGPLTQLALRDAFMFSLPLFSYSLSAPNANIELVVCKGSLTARLCLLGFASEWKTVETLCSQFRTPAAGDLRSCCYILALLLRVTWTRLHSAAWVGIRLFAAHALAIARERRS